MCWSRSAERTRCRPSTKLSAGRKPGQELTFEVSSTRLISASRSLAGQTVGYDVTVKAIKRKDLPGAQTRSLHPRNLATIETLEQTFEEQAAGDGERTASLRARSRISAKEIMLGAAGSGSFQFPVPESFVQQQIDARLDRGLRALAQQGMKARRICASSTSTVCARHSASRQ